MNDEDNCWHGCVVNDQIGERPTAPDLKKEKDEKEKKAKETSKSKE